MKKSKILMMIIALVAFLGFNLKTNAATAPSTIVTGELVTTKEYVPGVQGYVKKLSDKSNYLYCEAAHLKYQTGVTMNVVGPIDQGFVYLMKNLPNSGDTYLDYYAVQVAVWWYKDILNGNDTNLTAANKTYITNNRNSNTACKLIYNLVQGAKGYKQSYGSIKFSSANVNFTEKNGSFVSDPITVSTVNMTSVKDIELVNAPKGTTIINNTVKANGGTFQVSVPSTSVVAGQTVNFSIKLAGVYNFWKVYEYFYTSAYQKVILDREYQVPYDTSSSMNLSLSKPNVETKSNLLVIAKTDEKGNPLSGAKLALYKGNCQSGTCAKTNLYNSWTSTTTVQSFTNIPVGTYTLVEEEAPAGYRLATKMLVNVASEDGSYTYTMVDSKNISVRISKTDITGEKELPGATLVLKAESGKEIDKWVSTSTAHYNTLEPGVYTLSETIAPEGYMLSTTTITFKVDDKGVVYEKNANGDFVKVEYIKMVNDVRPSVNISKLDSDNNTFVSGATLEIKDSKGQSVAKWTTTSESYYVSLNPGEYVLTEVAAPEGYNLNPEPIYFKIGEDGKLFVKNTNNEYIEDAGIIMYDVPVGEIIEVPKTGLSSTLTYVIGAGMLAAGAIVLVKYGKEN